MRTGQPPAQRAAESEDDEFGPAPLSLLRAEERRAGHVLSAGMYSSTATHIAIKLMFRIDVEGPAPPKGPRVEENEVFRDYCGMGVVFKHPQALVETQAVQTDRVSEYLLAAALNV